MSRKDGGPKGGAGRLDRKGTAGAPPPLPAPEPKLLKLPAVMLKSAGISSRVLPCKDASRRRSRPGSGGSSPSRATAARPTRHRRLPGRSVAFPFPVQAARASVWAESSAGMKIFAEAGQATERARKCLRANGNLCPLQHRRQRRIAPAMAAPSLARWGRQADLTGSATRRKPCLPFPFRSKAHAAAGRSRFWCPGRRSAPPPATARVARK